MLSGQAGWLGEETSIREGRSAQKGELWAACSEEMCRLFCIPFCDVETAPPSYLSPLSTGTLIYSAR